MWKIFLLLSVVVCVHGLCKLTGVNQAGAEFGDNRPGVLGKDYIYPTTSADYFVGKKMNVFRLPFLWERVIRTKGANFTAVDINSYVTSVNYMSRSAYVIIDPHNYGRGFGGLIGESSTSIQDFVNFWIKLANIFKNNSRVIFALMNEPHDNNIWIWRSACQAAVNGIRGTGATQLILVPGIAYTGAGSWISSKNSEVMWDIRDPKNNYAYEVHQYFDEYSTGTTTQCVSASFGADKLKAFTEWARTYNKMGFLGEFGAANSPVCLAAIKNLLSYMSQNTDVWLGWTYWAGGPWWGEHFMTLQPNSSVANRAQWSSVSPYLAKSVPTSLVVGKTTPPGPVYVAIYKDSFYNSYGDWGWAPHNNSYTAFKRSGSSSISFSTGSGKSLCYVCYSCVNSTSYTFIQFWIYLSTGSTDGISVSLVNVVNNSPKAVAPSIKLTKLLKRSFAAKTWLQVTVPLANWTSAQAFDGFILSGSSGSIGQVGYLDDIFAVRYVYGATPAKRSLESTNGDVAFNGANDDVSYDGAHDDVAHDDADGDAANVALDDVAADNAASVPLP